MNKLFFGLSQWATRLVYTKRYAIGLYKMASQIRAKFSYFKKGLTQISSHRLQTAPKCSPPPTAYARYQQEFSEVPGWFLTEAQAAWDCLFTFQRNQHIQGSFLEIGVWRGKSAALSTLHAASDETCVYVDRMILAEFKEVVQRIRPSKNLFLEMRSESLLGYRQVLELATTFRWIHIDGEHSGTAVMHDLRTADRLLANHGMICVDDFPSNAYPQVHFAVIEFLSQHPHLTMVACGHNKGYICRQQSAPRYLRYIKDDLHRDMTARGSQVTIWKSGRPGDINCFGITDRVDPFDYRGPDWNPSLIDI